VSRKKRSEAESFECSSKAAANSEQQTYLFVGDVEGELLVPDGVLASARVRLGGELLRAWRRRKKRRRRERTSSINGEKKTYTIRAHI